MRPTDVLAYRRILYDQAREFLRNQSPPNVDEDTEGWSEADWDRWSDREITYATFVDIEACTSQGETYYVSADMSAVAKAAAPSLPDEELQVGDLPSNRGFLIYDSPIAADNARGTVEGVAWQEFDEEFKYADDADDAPHRMRRGVRIYPLIRHPEHPHQLIPFMRYQHPRYGTAHPMEWEYSTWTSNPEYLVEATDDEFGIAAVLRATWTIMQQSLSVLVRTQVDRAERRRSARAGLASDVLVVRLRRRSLDGPATDDAGDPVPWSHRWLVSGHWRNQWLPSRACHRLQWISSYVKGPENKPLVVKDRVTAWVR
jgi:hypothetical protein